MERPTSLVSRYSSMPSRAPSTPRPALLHAAERRRRRRRVDVVDADHAELQLLHGPERPATATVGVHVRRQAVVGVVRHRDRLVVVVEHDDRRDGTEGLLAVDEHVGGDVGEQRRRVEVAGVEAVVGEALAAGDERARPCRARRRPGAPSSPARASSISGPTVTPSVKPLPAFSAWRTAAPCVATNCSAMPRCTSMRLGQMHAWPVLRNFTAAAPLAACTGSASSNTRNGAWPPSSMLTRFTLRGRLLRDELADLGGAGEGDLAHLRVGDQLARRRSRDRSVVTRFTTPSGRPISSKILNTSTASSGVCSAGLSTMVQPAASAGPIFRVSIDTG